MLNLFTLTRISARCHEILYNLSPSSLATSNITVKCKLRVGTVTITRKPRPTLRTTSRSAPQQLCFLWPEITEEVSLVLVFYQYNVDCMKHFYNCMLLTSFPSFVGQDCSQFIIYALTEFPACLQTISGIISSTETNRFF